MKPRILLPALLASLALAVPAGTDASTTGRALVLLDRPAPGATAAARVQSRAVIARQWMAAYKPRAAATSRQSRIHRRNNRLFRAANIRDQRRRRTNGRRLNHAFRNRIHRRRNHNQLRLLNAGRQIGNPVIDRPHRARRIQARLSPPDPYDLLRKPPLAQRQSNRPSE